MFGLLGGFVISLCRGPNAALACWGYGGRTVRADKLGWKLVFRTNIGRGAWMVTRREFMVDAASAGLIVSADSQSGSVAAEKPKKTSSRSTKTCRIPHTDLTVSRIAYGCAYLTEFNREPLTAGSLNKAVDLIDTACESSITFFDLADHYGFGKAETAFGEALRRSPGLRDRLVIQSKCGFTEPYESRYDSSREHIVASVDGSLKRLGIDHLDILLLHTPDPLAEPDDVAAAFEEIQHAGKVRYFGVSNYSASQIELLKKSVRQPLVVNQLPIGLANYYLIMDGLISDGNDRARTAFAGLTGVLDYCRVHDMQIQAYSPLRGNLVRPPLESSIEEKEAGRVLADMAAKKGTNTAALALAWLLRHPAGIVPVIGPTRREHIVEDCQAAEVVLTRDEWYDLYIASVKVQRAM
jgi:predicted oxidoreductase